MNQKILQGNSQEKLKELQENSIDLIVTDPPYGYSFMNKDWDKAVISVDTWRECLRVLKPGSWAYIMSAPRQDVLSHMIVNLGDAGFKTDFTSVYYTYASGFPKAANISKLVDKKYKKREEYFELGNFIKKARLKLNKSNLDISKFFPSKSGGLTGRVSNWETAKTVPTKHQWLILKKQLQLDDSFDWLIEQETKRYEEAQREIIGTKQSGLGSGKTYAFTDNNSNDKVDVTKSETNLAKKLDGSYAGFQPKPALEVILVCMKPLEEKSYVEQAMSNGKGITWLDDCRIPFVDDKDVEGTRVGHTGNPLSPKTGWNDNNMKTLPFNPPTGRFPPNLLVSDDVLNDGINHNNSTGGCSGVFNNNVYGKFDSDAIKRGKMGPGDSGSFSRYFDLDACQAQFLIVEKASKSEKNAGLELKGELEKFCDAEFDGITPTKVNDGRTIPPDNPFQRGQSVRKNTHPTVKPVSLMSYLITMGSREGDTVLDPFAGSGTTLIAASILNRNSVGIELNQDYCDIMKMRLDYWKNKTFEKIQKIKKQAEKKKIVPLETFL